MKTCLLSFATALLFISLGSVHGLAQGSPSNDALATQAEKEYAAGQYSEAERDFSELVKLEPANIFAYLYLGQSLFRQQKYVESLAPYEKARELETAGAKLTTTQGRILTDQLVMAYGISGDLKKSRAVVQAAIKSDPDYPLNYYNLACISAEESDKTGVLANLSLAFQHKDQMIKGDKMPDPRADSSFQKYLRDPDFEKLMKELGYSS